MSERSGSCLRGVGVLLALAVLLAFPGLARATTFEFSPVADTYVSGESLASGHGNLSYLKYAPSRTAFMRFGVHGLAGPVARATLQLYAMTDSPAGGVELRRVDGEWDEGSLVALNAPPLGREVASADGFETGTWVDMDVTPLVEGDGEVDVALTSPAESTAAFASRESALVPRLVVETGVAATSPPPPPDARAGWQLLFEDNFDGTSLGPAWTRYGEDADWPGHDGNGLRVARAVAVGDGRAVITAREVDGVIESGAFTLVEPAYRTTYGRYEARVRIDPDPSHTTNGVALLWNVDDLSRPWWDGETDFWETGVDHSDWSAFVHYGDPTTQAFCDPKDLDWRPMSATSWHDVALVWNPTRLQVTVDGYVEGSCRWTDPAMIADWPQRLTFQLDAIARHLGNTVVRMEIDRAAIYTRSSATQLSVAR